MAAVQILRVRRSDVPGEHLPVKVTLPSEAKPFSLQLVATEHVHVYHASIRESTAKSLQSSTFAGDMKEWQTILHYSLLHKLPAATAAAPESCRGVEMMGAVNGSSITLTLRKNIGGITQRLGAIRLDEDDEREELDPFEWVDRAVAYSDECRAELAALQSSVDAQRDEVAKLSAQLDDLVRAKKEHEAELLRKFAALLNSKKLKIRDQQRLLNGAQVNPSVAVDVDGARQGAGRKPESSRKGKRKATVAEEESEEGRDDGLDGTDSLHDDVEDLNGQETPEPFEDGATDDDDSNGLDEPRVRPQHQNAIAESGRTRKDAEVNTDGMDVEGEEPSRPPKEGGMPDRSLRKEHSAPEIEAADVDGQMDDYETEDELD